MKAIVSIMLIIFQVHIGTAITYHVGYIEYITDDNTALIAGCVAAGALLIIIVVSVVVCKYRRGRADEERSDSTTDARERRRNIVSVYPPDNQNNRRVSDEHISLDAGYLTTTADEGRQPKPPPTKLPQTYHDEGYLSPEEYHSYNRISRDSQGYLTSSP